jgi:hypothetical protein
MWSIEPGLFTDGAHLQHHRREDVGVGHGIGQAGAGGHFLLDFFGRLAYTELPDAPPTESSASTKGTPAANMVAAFVSSGQSPTFSTKVPKIGHLQHHAVHERCTFSLRFQACKKK